MKSYLPYLTIAFFLIIILNPLPSYSKWEKLTPVNPASKLVNMDFISCDTGIVAENDPYSTCDITSESGDYWDSFTTPVTNIYDVKLMRGDRGVQLFIAGYSDYSISGVFYYSLDEGKNWNIMYFDGEKNREYAFSVLSLIFTDSHTLFLTGLNGAILKSQDTGKTWKRTFTGTNNEAFTTISFGDLKTGYAASGKGMDIYNVNNLYKSIDSGNTWKKLQLPVPYITISKLVFVSADTGFIFGSYDSKEAILKTTNGGSSWFNSYISDRFGSVTTASFIDKMNGYAINDSNKIIQTTNGGYTWILDTLLDTKLISIKMISKDCGYVCGDSGNVYKLKSYSAVKDISNDDLKPEIFPNPSSGVINIKLGANSASNYNLMIYDINGNQIKNMYLANQNNMVSIEELIPGIYYLIVSGNNKFYGETVIKL